MYFDKKAECIIININLLIISLNLRISLKNYMGVVHKC